MDLKGTIVFSSGKAGDYDIFSVGLAKKEMKQLTSGDCMNDCPRFSPDGSKVVFISNRSGTPEIWLMNSDGKDQKQITATGKWHNTPDWSVDGKKLVFCGNYDGNVDVYTMNLDGSGLTQITDYEGMDFDPQFSPDGKKIIFTSRRSGNDDIWVHDLGTGENKQLTTYEYKDASARYSPDGSLIAFVCDEGGPKGYANLEIYLMDGEGKNRRRITNNIGTDRYVAWSPDGKFLVYTSAKPLAAAERLMVADVEKAKVAKVNYDRQVLEDEIQAWPKSCGLFHILPEFIVGKTYPESYFGTERRPDWKK